MKVRGGKKMTHSLFFFISTVGYYVPKSDGEFYQFCYVTHAGDIRGASTPFQFRPATPTEELLTVTEDDSNSDILVVTTKTGLLEVDRTTSRSLFFFWLSVSIFLVCTSNRKTNGEH